MPALVQREVAPAGVGVGVVFLEAILDVVGLGFHRHPHAHADVVGDLAAVGFQAGDHLHHALAFQHAAFADGAGDIGDVFDTGRRVQQAVAGHGQAGGVADRGAFDAGLAAVEEAVEHLRVQPAACRLLGRQAVIPPHGFRRAFAEVRQPLVAAAGRHHREAAGAGPVHQVADQRRLVAEGQRIHHAGLRRTARQQRAAEGVGLHGDVDHVLAVVKGLQAVLHRGDRVAGAFHHHVNGWVLHQGQPVIADVGAAVFQRVVQRRGLGALRVPAHARQVGAGVFGRQVGNAYQVHARCARHLGQVHGAELAGADQGHAHGLVVGGALFQLGMQVHGGFLSGQAASTSSEVSSALRGRPFFHGRSTG